MGLTGLNWLVRPARSPKAVGPPGLFWAARFHHEQTSVSLKGLQTYEQRDFGGLWSLPDPPDVDARGALAAQNCIFNPGMVGKRPGFLKIYSVPLVGGVTVDSVFAMFNWVSELGDLLAFKTQLAGVQIMDIGGNPLTPTVVDTAHIAGGNAYTATFYPAGTRLTYVQWFGQTISNLPGFVGSHPGNVLKTAAGTWVADSICSPPMTYSVAATEPAGGIITAGLHNIGYRILDRSGYLGRPCPDSGATIPTPQTFVPIQFTSSGGKNLSITLNPGGGGWPVNGYQVQIIMSPVSNPNKYYLVPGATALLPVGGGAASKTIAWSIDDATLIQTRGAECTNSLNLYSQGVGGTNLLECYHVTGAGNRTFYLVKTTDQLGNATSQVIISDPGSPQTFSSDQHFVGLPGGKQVISVFDLLGTTYLLGPHWTYRTADNNDLPSTWPGPFLVDGQKGTLHPRAVSVSPSGAYAWIADGSGLYYFDGNYAPLPISYLQSPDWNTINWTTEPYAICLKDDPVNHRVYFLAPLLVAPQTVTNFIMVWDYTNGLGPYDVKYSKWPAPAGPYAIELVENDLHGTAQMRALELWIAGQYAIERLTGTFDAPVYHDHDAQAGTAVVIDWQYDPPMAPRPSTSATFQGASSGSGTGGEWLKFQNAHLRVKGTGTLQTTIYSYDRAKNAVLSNITLTASPDKPILRRFSMNSPGLIYHFRENTVDGNCVLSGIRTYYNLWVSNV